MKWPLKNQILVPMIGITLAALTAVSALNAYLALQRTRSRVERDLHSVAMTLADTNFPLTDRVLLQMQGLSGAEFVLCDDRGATIASSARLGIPLRMTEQTRRASPGELRLGAPIVVDERRFLHAPIAVRRSPPFGRSLTLHVLYPETSYAELWRHAVYPPLTIGAVAVVLVVLFGLGVAARVAEPVRRLQTQVDGIAGGDYRQLEVPQRDDEIAELSRAVNRMAQLLEQYEQEVRRGEQLRTLSQLGGGLAHQIRNSITGCRMAVELHLRQCSLADASESLEVAKRQLALMEKYLQRFLSLGTTRQAPHRLLDMCEVVENVAELIRPTASHMDVIFDWTRPKTPVMIQGAPDALEQLLSNLLMNAVEAASRVPLRSGLSAAVAGTDLAMEGVVAKRIAVRLSNENDRVRIEVRDTGTGPAPELHDRLYEPFVTDKPDGTGLGLAVSREIAIAHGGNLSWTRHNGVTSFILDLPNSSTRTEYAQTAGR